MVSRFCVAVTAPCTLSSAAPPLKLVTSSVITCWIPILKKCLTRFDTLHRMTTLGASADYGEQKGMVKNILWSLHDGQGTDAKVNNLCRAESAQTPCWRHVGQKIHSLVAWPPSFFSRRPPRPSGCFHSRRPGPPGCFCSRQRPSPTRCFSRSSR